MWVNILTKEDGATRAEDDVDLDDVTERYDKVIAALVQAAASASGRRAFFVFIVNFAAAVEVLVAGNV